MEPCKCGPQIANLKQDVQKLLLTLNDVICKKLQPMEKRLSKLESEANDIRAIPTNIKTVIEIEQDVEKLKNQNNEVQMKLKSHDNKLEIKKDDEATNEKILNRVEALESGKKFEELISQRLTEFNKNQSHHHQEDASGEGTVGDSKAIEDRLAFLEDEARRNQDFMENSIEKTLEQSEKTLEKLEAMKVECENSKSKCVDLILSKVKTIEANSKMIQDDVTKVEANLENTNLKLDVTEIAKTKLDLLEEDYKTFRAVDWGVFKREVRSCGTKLDNLELLLKDDNIKDIIKRVDAMEKDAESTKENVAMNYQRLETMSNSISRLEAKTMINKLKCSYCPRKMGGFIGMNLHMKSVHPEIPFIPHPEKTQETGTTNNETHYKDSNLRCLSALNVKTNKNKFEFDNSHCHDSASSKLLPIENALKHKLKLMNQ